MDGQTDGRMMNVMQMMMSSTECAVRWYRPVTSGRQEVDAAVDSGVWYPPLAVHVQLLPQVLLVLVLDVRHYWLPAAAETGVTGVTGGSRSGLKLSRVKVKAAGPHQLSLLIWSPKPGVSTTVSFIFTPFSSMTVDTQTQKQR